ncbi:MAG: hypothetical protein FWE82_04415, partial [Defluviitaleaceae bacterium]|nr:hypothetical protein [Defluviitaleaceae bacterium]
MINAADKKILRETAKKYLEYANRPVMKERERLWRLHNTLKGERPMIAVEWGPFGHEFIPALNCESSDARELEYQFVSAMANEDFIGDDKVI